MTVMRTLVDQILSTVNGVGFPVGDSAAPTGASLPYSVVYPIGDFDRSGPINDGQADIETEIQVTSVGETREQAAALSDLIRPALIGLAGTTVGASKILLVDLLSGMTIERDDDVQPPLFYGIDTFLVSVTPA